ncbi:MAG: exo-alpha-sialidase [Clostridia bacterium]|nr:exo-alpha-sialidase [Clostridia bacterium]
MEIIKQGVVLRNNSGYFQFHGWPSACVDEKGTLYAVCSGQRIGHLCPTGKTLMGVSYDNGETWSSPIIVNDTELDDRDAGIISIGENELLLTWFNNPAKNYRQYYQDGMRISGFSDIEQAIIEGYLNAVELLPDDTSGSFIRISKDSGKSWSEKIKVPVSAPHGPIKLSDGRLLYLGRETDSNIEQKDRHICAAESKDGGKSWNIISKIDFPDGYTGESMHEPHVVELSNGSLLGAIRWHTDNPDYALSLSILLSYSNDGGYTWTKPQPTGIQGIPPHLMRHSSGAVILSYADRYIKPGEKVKISYDDGKTFGEELVLDVPLEAEAGYPCTVELPDKSLFTVYYQRLKGDKSPSILYTKWKL